MKKMKPKADLKKGEARAKTHPVKPKRASLFYAVNQNDACVEVVADLWEIIVSDNDDIDYATVENLIRERGVSKEFLQELMDSRVLEKESLKDKALASLRVAYNKLPKDLQKILDDMDSDDMCEAICGTETDEEDEG